MSLSTTASRMPVLACVLYGFLAMLLPTGGALADDAAIQALRQEIAELRARVERLEGDVKTGVPVNPAKTVQPEAGGWRTPGNWQLLTKGMSDDRVVEILGEAERVRVVGKYEFWHYGDGMVRLYLGRLKSWDRP